MRYDLSGKEIKDCTDIKVFMIDLEASHITDPDTVRCFHSKLPLEEILLFGQAFLLLIVLFGCPDKTQRLYVCKALLKDAC